MVSQYLQNQQNLFGQEKSSTGSFSLSRLVGFATEHGWMTLQVVEKKKY
jgi:hypothetical protein